MDQLSDLVVFVRVVALSSFTAAADELQLSKAAVSKYVSRLEERLGARLLNRTTRRLTLTEAGAALYRRGAEALADIREAEEEVAQIAGEPRGHLRIVARSAVTTTPRSSNVCWMGWGYDNCPAFWLSKS